MKRFNLRTLLVVIALIAIALAAYPRVRYYLKWRKVRADLQDWAANLERQEGNVEIFVGPQHKPDDYLEVLYKLWESSWAHRRDMAWQGAVNETTVP